MQRENTKNRMDAESDEHRLAQTNTIQAEKQYHAETGRKVTGIVWAGTVERTTVERSKS